MLPEDPILLPEIIGHVFLVAVHPASGREYEEAQSVGHSLRLLAEQPLAPTLFRRFANLGRFVAPYGVPLCGRAIEILREARMIGDAGPLVFTDRGGMPLDTKQFRRLLERCGIACVPHGFRSSFRDWAAEETDHPREVIEAALAHVVQNKVEAAYARSDLFERRRRLMNDWSTYLNGIHRPDNSPLAGSLASRLPEEGSLTR